MNAPLSRELRRAISKLVEDGHAILDAVPPAPKREKFAPRILELALDGLDNIAIARELGIGVGTVSQTISYARRKKGFAIPRWRRSAKDGFLVHLDEATRVGLHAEAARRGVGPHELAAALIGAGLGR